MALFYTEDPDLLLLWASFINSERKEEFDMLASKDPYIESAYQQLQIISQNQEKRLEYEAREKAVRDHFQRYRTFCRIYWVITEITPLFYKKSDTVYNIKCKNRLMLPTSNGFCIVDLLRGKPEYNHH